MSFLLKWLRPQTSSRVGLRPHRTIELALAVSDAYGRVVTEIEATLGANISLDDREGKCIEAGFGVINNERVRITLAEIDASHTIVRIEAFFRAGATVPERSAAVDALAAALMQAR